MSVLTHHFWSCVFFPPVTLEPSIELGHDPEDGEKKTQFHSKERKLETVPKLGRQHSTHRSDFPVVVLFGEIPCQAKVTNLQQEALSNQNIPGSQVTMDTLQTRTKRLSLSCHFTIIELTFIFSKCSIPRAIWRAKSNTSK